jgi:hypothetical protein
MDIPVVDFPAVLGPPPHEQSLADVWVQLSLKSLQLYPRVPWQGISSQPDGHFPLQVEGGFVEKEGMQPRMEEY